MFLVLTGNTYLDTTWYVCQQTLSLDDLSYDVLSERWSEIRTYLTPLRIYKM